MKAGKGIAVHSGIRRFRDPRFPWRSTLSTNAPLIPKSNRGWGRVREDYNLYLAGKSSRAEKRLHAVEVRLPSGGSVSLPPCTPSFFFFTPIPPFSRRTDDRKEDREGGGKNRIVQFVGPAALTPQAQPVIHQELTDPSNVKYPSNPGQPSASLTVPPLTQPCRGP